MVIKKEKDDIEKMRIQYKNILCYLILALLISFIFLTKCYYAEIYPFGTNTIDRGDFFGQIVPSYYFLWDVIHGDANLFFDWYTGLGQNMSAVITHFNLLSPFNVLFFFCSRSNIENYMTYYLLLKIIAAAVSMHIVLNHLEKEVNELVKITFSVIYAFCGFNMQNLEVPCWMDAIVIFPFFVLGMHNLLECGKKRLYIITLWLILILDVIQTVNFTIFAVLYVGTALVLKRVNLKKIVSLVAATAISFGLSAPVFIPSLMQLINSYRLAGIGGYFDILFTVDYSDRFKWLMLYNLGFAVGIIIYSLVYKVKKNSFNRKDLYRLVIIIFLSLPILLESTNLLWSLGSYVNFPMRMGYMVPAWIVIVATRYIGELKVDNTYIAYTRLKTVMIYAITIIVGIAIIIFDYYIIKNNKGYLYIALSLILSLPMCFLWFKTYFSKVILSIVSVVILINSYLLVDAYVIPTSHDSAPVIASAYPVDYSNILDKIKNFDGYEDSNYPIVMRQSALSSYMHVISNSQHEMNYNLGYSTIHTRLSDVGGTFFSDALLGVRSVFGLTDSELPEELYEYAYQDEYFSYYDTIYNFEGLVTVSSIDEENKSTNPFDYQNNLSDIIFNKPIFEISEYNGSNGIIELSEIYTDESVVYLYSSDLTESEIKVNDKAIGIFHRFDSDNTIYPNIWNNGIICLGVYKDEEIKIEVTNVSDEASVFIATCNLDEYKSINYDNTEILSIEQDNSSIRFTIENNYDDRYVIVPIYNDSGWNCIVNGKKTELGGIINDSIMVIPLDEGNNIIELYYFPQGLFLGIIIGVFTLILLITRIFIKNNLYKFALRNKAETICLFVMKVIFIAFIVLLYLLPLICFVLEMV